MFVISSFFLFACVVVASIGFLAVNKKQRDVVLDRIAFTRRRNSGANTPPRSLSPGKRPSKLQEPPLYIDTFPPNRRESLGQIQSELPKLLGKSLSQLTSTPENATTKCVPFTASVFDLKGSAFTATGFSTDEIKALGNFPDYATLSGVPLPKAYPDFEVEKARPRPYRPFRWAYHQTMSLTKMEPDWWLELDGQYAANIKLRQDLFKKHGKDVLDYLPGTELACKELMEMCIQFLCARYPHYFRLDKERMILHNDILRTKSHLQSEHPLHVLLNNIPEDFAITVRNPENGYYYCRGGIICSSLGWNLGSKIGLQLHEIHAPIPDYKEKMQFSMDRYFAKKPTDKPIQRGSWGLEMDTPLYMPPGDPHEKLRNSQQADLTIDQCNLRVDWQTLRRLPLSGAIIFNFKALFTPVVEFRDEPFVPSIALKVLKDGKKTLMKYKNTWHVEHVVIPELEKWEKEQKGKGWVPEEWEVRTLDESPWFPRWEEKWHRQQGF